MIYYFFTSFLASEKLDMIYIYKRYTFIFTKSFYSVENGGSIVAPSESKHKICFFSTRTLV